MTKNNISTKAKIYKNAILIGKCTVEEGAVIFSNCVIRNSHIKKNCIIQNSTIENSVIGENTKIINSFIENSTLFNDITVGPYAHIRPNTIIKNNCKIGNFVEIKNSEINKNTKISHLAYVGDATIGENCNIGCGVIFANYNGIKKQHSVVGNNCFIGSNCNIIAPVNIANNTYISAGTTLTKNTNEFDFVIGRARETIKTGYAKKYIEIKKE